MVSASAASVSVCLILLLLGSLMGPVMAEVYFSSLPRNLIVSASPKPGQVLEAGVDNITITWGLNQTLPPNTAAAYKNVKVRLCYAPNSQADRGWRKTTDDLKKDKTCQFGITQQPYSEVNSTFVYGVERSIPSATYFIRVYAVDSSGAVVAYGQTTDAKKKADLFDVVGITGRHASLDVAAACFSAFSVFSLVFFLVLERKKTKK
ncbi:high-affinity nitrate transporter-activating protein 2.1-like [Dendrobium catenatum]|uniref:High-affinity nitrate transporter n=1 Tax=Dendrobium catenatum TaxID=906689 RepID=A0A2I0XGH2_9ASPA|nr:high-affinity nitrate transporter-activating protein 2.1-like [Dendrobium catenatum]PKU87011.1 High-affinity nitrate transporter 3.1 [Dendrobium catenatum]